MEKNFSTTPPLPEATLQPTNSEIDLTDSPEAVMPDPPISGVYRSMGSVVVLSTVRHSTSRGSYFDA